MACCLFFAELIMLNYMLDWNKTEQSETRREEGKTKEEKEETVAKAVLPEGEN